MRLAAAAALAGLGKEVIVSSVGALVGRPGSPARLRVNTKTETPVRLVEALAAGEAAGVAWSAHLFGTPLIALKSVTDIVDGDQAAADEFLANLATATAALHDKLAAVLAWLGEGREVGRGGPHSGRRKKKKHALVPP